MSGIRRVWVTRAEPGAARTAARLTELGFEPVVAPLLAIRPLSLAPPDLTGAAALAFTSANGVAAFVALAGAPDLPVFTVGDATAEACRLAGFGRVRSADGALADLARLLDAEAPREGQVLNPGALEPSGDLSAQVGRVRVSSLPVYAAVETGAPPPTDIEAVLIHSPRAARALAASAAASVPTACVISAAAAAALGDRIFAEVRIAAVPTEAALLRTLGNPAPAV